MTSKFRRRRPDGLSSISARWCFQILFNMFLHLAQLPILNTGNGLTTRKKAGSATFLNVQYLAGVMSRYGLAEQSACRAPWRECTVAWACRRETTRYIRSADLLINVSGTLERPEDRRVNRLISTRTCLYGKARARPLDHKWINVHDVQFSFSKCPEVCATGHK